MRRELWYLTPLSTIFQLYRGGICHVLLFVRTGNSIRNVLSLTPVNIKSEALNTLFFFIQNRTFT